MSNRERERTRKLAERFFWLAWCCCSWLFFLALGAAAQTPVVVLPTPKFQGLDNNGQPLAGGCVWTYASGTSTLQTSYSEPTGTTANTNPVILDGGGYAPIYITTANYRIQLWSNGGVTGNNCASGTMIYQQDGVIDQGLNQQNGGAVQLAPAGGANQTIAGPITANQFTGPATALTNSATLTTASNSPTLKTTQPAASGQTYNVPDPTTGGNFVINPSGNSGTADVLDCTLAGITCKRTATFFFSGGSCNNTTPGLGFDTFGTNSFVPQCITGTNTQRGVSALPAAYTHLQSNTGTNSATTTVTTTYPAALTTGDMLVLSVAFNATTTITGCTDGTNAYTQVKHIANGALSLDIWVFHNATTKAAGTTLTCTFSVAATSALKWHEYLVPGPTSTDVSASNTGTGTAVTTGTTASTTQATELVFAAAGDLAAPTLIANSTGYSDHTVLNNSTTVQVDDAGIIQQTIAGQSAGFTLGSSQSWASAIATFKVTNASSAIGQRTIALPGFFNASAAVNSSIKWVAQIAPIGTTNVVLGAAMVCTADGSTDDPAFNADTTATVAVPTSAANVPTSTALNALAGSCAAGNTLHFQIKRLRYNASDIYEGFVQVLGVNLQIGITQ